MKFCSTCGAQLNDGQIFCENCGAKIPDSPNPQTQAPAQPSMKWFKFLIYFSLFAGAVVNLGSGIAWISGAIYAMQGGVSADTVYSVFGSLKAVDTLYGVMQIALAGFYVYTRFRLAKFCSNGPTCLYVICVLNACLILFYAIVAGSICGIDQVSSSVPSIGIGIGLLITNVQYFKKRKHLFVN